MPTNLIILLMSIVGPLLTVFILTDGEVSPGSPFRVMLDYYISMSTIVVPILVFAFLVSYNIMHIPNSIVLSYIGITSVVGTLTLLFIAYEVVYALIYKLRNKNNK